MFGKLSKLFSVLNRLLILRTDVMQYTKTPFPIIPGSDSTQPLRNDVMQHTKTPFPIIPGSDSTQPLRNDVMQYTKTPFPIIPGADWIRLYVNIPVDWLGGPLNRLEGVMRKTVYSKANGH